jgi:hypothetical protein
VILLGNKLVIIISRCDLEFGMNTKVQLSLLRNCWTSVILLSTTLIAFSQTYPEKESIPIGSYIWYPGKGGPKSDADCISLVEKMKPTEEQVQQWYWGRTPNNDFASMPFFLIVSAERIETTFSAEGDFDYGDVKFEETREGETKFLLKPDEHPDNTIVGKITAHSDSQIVKVTLFAIPLDEESKDRVSYFCRFQSGGVEI